LDGQVLPSLVIVPVLSVPGPGDICIAQQRHTGALIVWLPLVIAMSASAGKRPEATAYSLPAMVVAIGVVELNMADGLLAHRG